MNLASLCNWTSSCCCTYILGALVLLFLVLQFVIQRVPRFEIRGKNFIVTGGSQGIGYSTAEALLKAGANVTIIARDPKKLKDAEESLRKSVGPNQKLIVQSADISNSKEIQRAVSNAAAAMDGRIDALIANAGFSIPGRFEELKDSDFEKTVQVNYLGTVWTIRAALPFMKPRGGRIVIVSSMAGLTGIMGYTAYSPTKFALRGLAESLHMELRPKNIQVTLVNPPDVDTPGLKKENSGKPKECKLIEEGSGLVKPEAIASDILSALKNWRFMVATGFDGNLSIALNAGMTPARSVFQLLFEGTFMGLLRVVSMFYLRSFNAIVDREAKKRAKSE